MPLCKHRQFRSARLLSCAALLISVLGASIHLRAQSSANSSTAEPITAPATLTAASAPPALTASTADLPDAPSALLAPQPASQPNAQSSSQSGQVSSSAPQTSQTPTSAPQISNNPDAVSPNGTQQTKRILGIMPNFRSVSADTQLPPMSAKEKFIIAGKDTFDYSSFIIAAIQAGFAMDGDSYPEFHQGVVGYGRYYWHTLADTTTENFFVGGLGPIVFHQDNRFYTLGHGGFTKRTYYALSRVLISRKDDGSPTFNYAEVIGSGASSGMSTLYYPQKYQTWTKVGQKWLTSDIIDGANFMVKEWWPDVNKRIFHTH